MSTILKICTLGAGIFMMLTARAGQSGTEPTKASEPPSIPAKQFHRDALANPPKEVSPETLAQWLAEKSTLLVDLRSASEYRAGHLQGAINISLTELTAPELARHGINSETRMVVYCDFQLMPTRMIALTTLGHPTLQQLGFGNVYTLEPLWQSVACKSTNFDDPCPGLLPFVAKNARE